MVKIEDASLIKTRLDNTKLGSTSIRIEVPALLRSIPIYRSILP